ncbi:polyketide synthase [Mycobacterium sp. 1100029.7]|nr:polyketide synthase [Mycobacterium sp. 1100029.7]
MTISSYQLPDGTIPVLLTADNQKLLVEEAVALLSYAASHPEVGPQGIAGMLFRTRPARRYRALAMVANRDELQTALRTVVDGSDHPSLVRNNTPAAARRLAYVCPGQGAQRPGMGRLFYETVPAFRVEVDRCSRAFEGHIDRSPLSYLLGESVSPEASASTVQPALFTQMAGLAAAWRSFGFAPSVTVGHSLGEIAAAYVSGAITLEDAVTIVAIRARAADKFTSGDYAMAAVATDRDTCEDLLARCDGWAQLSVVNSPSLLGISGARATIREIVDTCTERGIFARIIDVRFPAHTSLIDGVGDELRMTMQRHLRNLRFLATDTECLGSALGGAITPNPSVAQYWVWNLRNIVRFDKAMAAATALDVDTFVELAEHPTLQLAMHENIAATGDERTALVVGTSHREATDLRQFARSVAVLAVHDANYPWASLGSKDDSPPALPLLDFPNTRMTEVRLWLPADGGIYPQDHHIPPDESVAATAEPTRDAASQIAPVQLLVEQWIRLSHRPLVSPRAIGLIDHTHAQPELIATLRATAADAGAIAHQVEPENHSAIGHFDTLVIQLPPSPVEHDDAASEIASFFSGRAWRAPIAETVTDCWLVTTGGESVLTDDAPPNLLHAALTAGFRSIGAENPGIRFRHLDLPAETTIPESANAIVAALHTDGEPELAMRDGGFYAKRLVRCDIPVVDSHGGPLDHVLIIGGTGNLGLEFCEHFARRGARRITLVSRSGVTARVADRLRQIGSTCPSHTQIRVVQCDVGDHAAVSGLADEHRDIPADLIIHAAVDYSAVDLAGVTTEQLDRALRAKVVGITQVLQTFPRSRTCRVLLCSSVAATIGGRGQIVYAATNRMLDAMAHRLRADGLDCVSVQWGQWNVHFDLDAASIAQLAAIGIIPMSPADALAVGLSPLRENAIVMAFDLERTRVMLEPYGYGPLLSQLSSPAIQPAPAAADTNLTHRVSKLLGESIGVHDIDTIDVAVPLVAIGLDSLQALDFRRRIKMEFAYELLVSDLLGGASIADVLSQLEAVDSAFSKAQAPTSQEFSPSRGPSMTRS